MKGLLKFRKKIQIRTDKKLVENVLNLNLNNNYLKDYYSCAYQQLLLVGGNGRLKYFGLEAKLLAAGTFPVYLHDKTIDILFKQQQYYHFATSKCIFRRGNVRVDSWDVLKMLSNLRSLPCEGCVFAILFQVSEVKFTSHALCLTQTLTFRSVGCIFTCLCMQHLKDLSKNLLCSARCYFTMRVSLLSFVTVWFSTVVI